MTKYIGPKTADENVATQADKLSLSSDTPDALTPDQAGAAGTATTAARSDHQHEILAGAAGTILPDDAAAEGASSSFARADHTHAITAAAPSANLTASTTNSEGTASSFARSDHSHAITTGAPGTITPDAVAATGTSASLARADHTHAIAAAAAGTITGTNSEGTSTSFARADHDHALGTDVVGSTQITADAVGSSEIAAGAVGTSELATAVGNFGAWTDYTPTLKQSGTVLHTKNFASYAQIGKIVIVNFRLTVGNPPGSTTNNVVSVSVPVAAKTKSLARCGSGSIYDDSTTTTYGGVWIQAFSDDTVVNFIGDWSAAGAWGTVPNLALANGDSVQGFLIYEAA